MITAAEARRTTKASLSDEEAEALMSIIEDQIRRVASQGRSSLRIEDNLSDAKKDYLRNILTEKGFSVLEVDFTICW